MTLRKRTMYATLRGRNYLYLLQTDDHNMDYFNPGVRSRKFYSTPTPCSDLEVQKFSTLTLDSDSGVPVFRLRLSTPYSVSQFFLLQLPTSIQGFMSFRLRLMTLTPDFDSIFCFFFSILSNSQLQLHTLGVTCSCNKLTIFLLLSLSCDFLKNP